jgi:hypothetical protein
MAEGMIWDCTGESRTAGFLSHFNAKLVQKCSSRGCRVRLNQQIDILSRKWRFSKEK